MNKTYFYPRGRIILSDEGVLQQRVRQRLDWQFRHVLLDQAVENGRFHLITSDHQLIECDIQRELFLPFAEIVSFRETAVGDLVLKSKTTKLLIDRQTFHYPDLYADLRQHIPILQEAEEVERPLRLRIKQLPLRFSIGVGLALIYAVYLFVTVGLWGGLFLMLPWLFFAVIVSAALGIPALYKWSTIDFSEQKIIARKLWGAKHIWPATEIETIKLVEKFQKRYRYRRYSETISSYHVHIQLTMGKVLRISQMQAFILGYSPERIVAIFDKLYPDTLVPTQWYKHSNHAPVSKSGDDAQAALMIDLGNRLKRESKGHAALLAFEKASQLSSLHHDSFAMVGEQYYELGECEKAIRTYRQSLKAAPGLVHFLPHYGQALLKMSNYAEAVEIFARATQENPKDYQSFYSGAMALNKVGRHEDAKSSLNCALSLKPDWIARAKQNPLLSQYLSDA
ncbi:MAG: tetratricopeptide repeat protein [Chloroflexi bacterium]|nr:tetratricopeptide repeat protein [Chloroflexota bacterium]